MSTPRNLDLTAHMDHRFGGLTTSLPLYGDALRETGKYDSQLAAFCDPDEAAPDAARPPVVFPFGRVRWTLDQPLRDQLRALVTQADAVHIHGIWREQCSVGGQFARAARKPYLVSAHGMIEPWALRNRALKKKVYWNLIEKRNLNSAGCLRALTSAEAAQYRELDLHPPIAVIPNGVAAPPCIDSEPFFRKFPDLQGNDIILFLGRLDKKKGIRLLCEAWARICSEFPDAHLVIAGPDAEGQQASLETFVAERGISPRVTFAGMLRGQEKWAALLAAGCFALPSFSEGFSIAVLEALSTGTPVILSRQCYFPEIEQYGCGWTVDPNLPQTIEAALRECLCASAQQRQDMGAHARRLARERFSWPVIGAQSAAVLDWMLGGGAPPSSVEIRS